ncbi:hypothetical protein F66182_10744, partial [Fusarium sp. NRRL 66182]
LEFTSKLGWYDVWHAVIRPSHVEMKVEFQLADHEITRQLFRKPIFPVRI